MSSVPLILPPGAELGGYTIEDVLGIGGMATVYRARQRSLNRPVALKVLNPRMAADTTFRARFQREGAMIAALDHPHVVPVYDSGEIDGRLFLAMRLVDGDTLADVLAGGGRTLTETLKLMTPVADALDAAHAAGLTHRDVKPQNILVDHSGRVYLADFGVARIAGGPELTVTGGFLGSVSYVAPEQIRGEEVGPAADVYAFAIVLHECLVGRTPFRSNTEAGVIHAHLQEPPPGLGPAGDPLALAVAAVLAGGLAKDPEDRPQRAVALMQGLGEAIAGASSEQLERRPAFESAVPVPSALGALDAPGAPPSGATVHDPQRRVVAEPARRPRRSLSVRGRWMIASGLAGVATLAIPIALALAPSDAPQPARVGAVSLTPPLGWTSAPLAAGAGAGGLTLEAGRQWTSPAGGASISVAPIEPRTLLAPRAGGNEGEAALIEIGDGTLRRWTLPVEGGEQQISVGATAEGAVMVACARPTQACQEAVASVAAAGGELQGDPVPQVAEQLAGALAPGGKLRGELALPSADRTKRESRATKLADAYAEGRKELAPLTETRAWDREVVDLGAALRATERAYRAIAAAARRRSTAADRTARASLGEADQAAELVLTRLARRGYVLER